MKGPTYPRSQEDLGSKRARLHERVALPRSIDHARDMAQLSTLASKATSGTSRVVSSMVLDHTDAFNQLHLHPNEGPYCTADLGAV